MALTISPLQESEIPDFVRIELEAFSTHPRMPMLWVNGYRPDVYAYYEASKLSSYHSPQGRFFKALDSNNGKLVGVSEWTFVLDPEAEARRPLTKPNEPPPANWPEGGNFEMRRFFKIEWQTWRNQYFGEEKKYIVLDILTVDPQCQRRGAGTALLSWGVDQADNLGVMMCLESTPTGLNLYKRFGFREVRVLRADMKQFGWMEPYDEDAATRVWMIREPRTEA